MKLYPLLLHFSLILLDIKIKKSQHWSSTDKTDPHTRDQVTSRRIGGGGSWVEEESLLVVFTPRHPPGPGTKRHTFHRRSYVLAIKRNQPTLSKKNQPK